MRLMGNALKRAIRTGAQLVAAGGLTALVSKLAGGLATDTAALVLMGWGVVVTYVQNLLEDKNVIPTVLKNEPVE